MSNARRLLVTSTAATLLAIATGAQQSRTYYDAAQIVLGPDDPAFERLIDPNGDGIVDALGHWRDGDTGHTILGLYENDGSGNFSPVWSHSEVLPGSTWDDDVLAVGDLDGDGLQDFALAYGSTILPYTTNGLGAPTARPPIELQEGYPIDDIAIGDIGGDGVPDIVAMTNIEVHVLPIDVAFPDPYAGTAITYDAGLFPIEIELIDVDGDRNLDVVLAQNDEVVLIPVSGGAIGTTTTFVPSPVGVNDIAVGDLEGDGDDDIVTFLFSGVVRVLRQEPGGTFTMEGPAPGGPATDLADIDGDGDLDGICCGSGGGPTEPDDNDNESNFEIAINRDFDGGLIESFRIPSVGAHRIAGAADVDGDGDVDLVAGRTIYYADGPIRNQEVINHDWSVDVEDVGSAGQLIDAEGDGDIDFQVDVGAYYRNDGAGGLSIDAIEIEGVPPGVNVAPNGYPGDWDGDGDLDFVVSYNVSPGVFADHLLIRLGPLRYQWGPQATTNGDLQHGRPRAVDLDGDDDLDLIVGTEFWTYLWQNDGTGFFTSLGSLPVHALEVTHIDADGHVDIFGVKYNVFADDNVVWYPGLGGGQFGNSIWVTNGSGRPTMADLDGDGDMDFAAPDGDTIELWLKNANGLFVETVVLPPEPGLHDFFSVAITDADADGALDLITGPAPDARFGALLYRATGPLAFEAPVALAIQGDLHADLDGDGDEDLIRGNVIHRSRAFSGSEDGERLQYGAGSAGSAGVVPVLGATGPFRAGETIDMVARGGPGQSPAFLLWSPASFELADFPFAGITLLVDPVAPGSVLLTLPSGGPSGVAGEGWIEVSVPIAPAFAGLTIHHQVFWIDAGSANGLLSSTAGLRITYGG